jgi:alpha-ketoglutarate-dependent 2,4-dichlorophenoxyacetate dioxygenase
MALSITRLHPLFGAQVHGINLATDLSPAVVAELSAVIAEHGIMVFRGQRLSNDEQVSVACQFGEPEVSTQVFRPGEALRVRPEIADVSNLDANGQPRGREDRHRMFSLGNQLWHTDSSFRQKRGAFSLLHAHGVPPAEGGETEFTDMRAVYDALPEVMRSRIAGMVAEHSLFHSRSLLGFSDFAAEERAALPPSQHKMAQVHAPSGRMTVYVASHASHILGMPVPDGRMLLRDLIEFATQPHFVHRHTWQLGDLVMWDNRCTLHRGRPYDESKPRDLRRVTTSDAAMALEQVA